MSSADAGPIIVFDGVCLLCDKSVQFVLRHDKACRYRFASVQSECGRAQLQRHGLDADAPQSMLLLEGGAAYVESDAVLRILGSFGGIHRAWRVARVVPRTWRDALYRLVARHRYRWFGRADQCWLPAPDHADRFLH